MFITIEKKATYISEILMLCFILYTCNITIQELCQHKIQASTFQAKALRILYSVILHSRKQYDKTNDMKKITHCRLICSLELICPCLLLHRNSFSSLFQFSPCMNRENTTRARKPDRDWLLQILLHHIIADKSPPLSAMALSIMVYL